MLVYVYMYIRMYAISQYCAHMLPPPLCSVLSWDHCQDIGSRTTQLLHKSMECVSVVEHFCKRVPRWFHACAHRVEAPLPAVMFWPSLTDICWWPQLCEMVGAQMRKFLKLWAYIACIHHRHACIQYYIYLYCTDIREIYIANVNGWKWVMYKVVHDDWQTCGWYSTHLEGFLQECVCVCVCAPAGLTLVWWLLPLWAIWVSKCWPQSSSSSDHWDSSGQTSSMITPNQTCFHFSSSLQSCCSNVMPR